MLDISSCVTLILPVFPSLKHKGKGLWSMAGIVIKHLCILTFFLVFAFLWGVGVEVLGFMLGTCFITELHPQPVFFFFLRDRTEILPRKGTMPYHSVWYFDLNGERYFILVGHWLYLVTKTPFIFWCFHLIRWNMAYSIII